jgi:hypothetical protein
MHLAVVSRKQDDFFVVALLVVESVQELVSRWSMLASHCAAAKSVRGMRKTERHEVEIDGAAVICARAREEGKVSEQVDQREREKERKREREREDAWQGSTTRERDQRRRSGRVEPVSDEQRLAILRMGFRRCE